MFKKDVIAIMQKEVFLKNLFQVLCQKKIDYVVLRNHDEIPSGVTLDKDIDLLVHPNQTKQVRKVFDSMGFYRRVDSKKEHIFCYGTCPHEHFFSKSEDVHVDVIFQLMYRSPNQGEWIPAHQDIQESMWNNRVYDNTFIGCWRPDSTDEMLHLLAHGIFDKQGISSVYQKKLSLLWPKVDKALFKICLEHLFFKFTPTIIQLIERNEFEGLFEKYISFKEY